MSSPAKKPILPLAPRQIAPTSDEEMEQPTGMERQKGGNTLSSQPGTAMGRTTRQTMPYASVEDKVG